MAHWQDRPEPRWKEFRFNQPYAKGLRRLKEEVLAKTDFDPATLWQWGTMQAMALVEVLQAAERSFGAEGQKVIGDAIARVGLDVGRQILAGTELPAGITAAEFASFYATVINRIAYASLEAPRIDGAGRASFDILWCPHQDHYAAFDCRVQRYFVQGMIDAAQEFMHGLNFDLKIDATIPAGKHLCFPLQNFMLWGWPPVPQAEAWMRFYLGLVLDTTEVACEIDGVPIANLERYRHQSPAVPLVSLRALTTMK